MTPAITSNPVQPSAMSMRKAERIAGLDFTKGTLVLFMVLYHWLNYFISTQGYFYRYLRFVTPSFIFISGFLISNVYLSKYGARDPRLPKRLMQRGLKILVVFLFLNLIISLFFTRSYDGKMPSFGLSPESLFAIYITGNIAANSAKAAAFYILVPISYLLLLSSALLYVCRFYKYTFHVVGGLLFLCIFILALFGIETGNLQLLAIGLLGVVMGYFRISKINTLAKHFYALVGVYACYEVLISIMDPIYPLQVLGVCLAVLLIYLLGAHEAEAGGIRENVTLVGKYSLVGYISQIVILQLLYRSLNHFHPEALELMLSFIAAFGLTILTVKAVDGARTKSAVVDSAYRAVFA